MTLLRATIRAGRLALLTLLALPAAAQEGYPLDGTWRGAWGPAGAGETPVVIVMKWNGEDIEGTINPGPASMSFASAQLEPSTWTVRIEAETSAGEPIRIEGVLSDIGAYNRRIDGSWTQAGVEHEFRIVRE